MKMYLINEPFIKNKKNAKLGHQIKFKKNIINKKYTSNISIIAKPRFFISEKFTLNVPKIINKIKK